MLSGCPKCGSKVLERLYKAPCRCPYQDFKCSNGHLCHGCGPNDILKEGPTHASRGVTWGLDVWIVVIFGFFVWLVLIFGKK